MTPYYQQKGITLYNNDCIATLKILGDNSIDGIVTDPPYGLEFMGKEWDRFPLRDRGRRLTGSGNFTEARGFAKNVNYGKTYETSLGLQDFTSKWAKEALRVLKPGGYLLAFGGTRTYHRMTCAIEDAGFEIRDMVEWLYGSGFPKSLNIGKAVDRLRGNEREIVKIKQHGKKDFKDNLYAQDPANANNNKMFGYGEEKITKGVSEWENWGTSLKPAHEPICMARKPLSEKTVAENVLKWGTGGINIDDCRVETEDKINSVEGGIKRRNKINQEQGFRPYIDGFDNQDKEIWEQNSQGRFPANLILDDSEEVRALFPTTGKSTGGRSGHTAAYSGGYKQEYYGDEKPGFGDSGSAARFFYCAKASKFERDAGMDGMENKLFGQSGGAQKALKNGKTEYQTGKNVSTGLNTIKVRKNTHPTVKPIALMEYLIKLVTPPNGIVLDPFMGSGSTGCAAAKLGYEFIGIDLEKDYCNISQARIKYWQSNAISDIDTNQIGLFN